MLIGPRLSEDTTIADQRWPPTWREAAALEDTHHAQQPR